MSECSIFAFGAVEFLDRFPRHMRILLHYKLGNTVAIVYGEIKFTEVDKNNTYFAAIVSIDGAGRINYRDAML